jgi:hypothetical protein
MTVEGVATLAKNSRCMVVLGPTKLMGSTTFGPRARQLAERVKFATRDRPPDEESDIDLAPRRALQAPAVDGQIEGSKA